MDIDKIEVGKIYKKIGLYSTNGLLVKVLKHKENRIVTTVVSDGVSNGMRIEFNEIECEMYIKPLN